MQSLVSNPRCVTELPVPRLTIVRFLILQATSPPHAAPDERVSPLLESDLDLSILFGLPPGSPKTARLRGLVCNYGRHYAGYVLAVL